MTGVGFYQWLCVCLCAEVNGCSLALMTVICIMDSRSILTLKDRMKRRRRRRKVRDLVSRNIGMFLHCLENRIHKFRIYS